jgi:hypothetical protein
VSGRNCTQPLCPSALIPAGFRGELFAAVTVWQSRPMRSSQGTAEYVIQTHSFSPTTAVTLPPDQRLELGEPAVLARIIMETFCAAIVCAVLGRVADADGHSPMVWAGVTLALCLASLLVPVPVLRLVLAGYVAIAAMFIYNLLRPIPR